MSVVVLYNGISIKRIGWIVLYCNGLYFIVLCCNKLKIAFDLGHRTAVYRLSIRGTLQSLTQRRCDEKCTSNLKNSKRLTYIQQSSAWMRVMKCVCSLKTPPAPLLSPPGPAAHWLKWVRVVLTLSIFPYRGAFVYTLLPEVLTHTHTNTHTQAALFPAESNTRNKV